MSEIVQNILSLYELNVLIQQTINDNFAGQYFWVKAEIHKLNVYIYSGHAYPEILEKKNNEVICSMRGIIWKSDLTRINQKFIDSIGQPLKENINALMLVQVRFDPKYGLSLQIKDIDPNYTLGELERQKIECIQKLQQEGIFDLNKKKYLSIVPQKLAIISVETSKGYNDLITTFQKYQNKYNIQYRLYPSLLQGEEAAVHITEQLKIIQSKAEEYDAVLIIRGGGGEVGLSCYNDYTLCKTIATFPIPIITGIGHSTNHTVAEMVAYHNGITPTDTAMFIIQKFEQFDNQLNTIKQFISQYMKQYFQTQYSFIQQLSSSISLCSKEIFHQQYLGLNSYTQWIKSYPYQYIKQQLQDIQQYAHSIQHHINQKISKEEKYLYTIQQNIYTTLMQYIHNQHQKLNTLKHHITYKSQQVIQNEQLHINSIEKQVQILHPYNILKRGYSIVFDENNRCIQDGTMLYDNQKIIIKFHSSEIETHINQLKIKRYE